MEEKYKSIWDEVDSPKEEAEDNPDPKQSENTTDGLFKVKNYENEEKSTKTIKSSPSTAAVPSSN